MRPAALPGDLPCLPPLPPRPGPRCCRCSPPPRPPTGFRGFFMPQPNSRACSGRAAPSTAGRCARRWRRRSAPRMRPAPGPGRTPTKPPRRRRCLFLRKFGRAMRTRAGSAAAMLDMLTRLGRTAAVADPPFGGKQPLPAILDADRAWASPPPKPLRSRGRSRPRTLGRNGPVGDLRRTGRRRSGAERDRRHPRRIARPPLPRLRGHKAQRRAHKRSARSGGAAERRA